MATESTDHKPQGTHRITTDGYEKRDANAKGIFVFVACLAAAGVVTHFLVARIQGGMQQRETAVDAWQPIAREAGAGGTSSFPRLQISPPAEMQQFRAREEALLHSYGWINRTAGIARIPIERAMELILEQGLPVSTGPEDVKLGPSSYELQLQRAREVPLETEVQ